MTGAGTTEDRGGYWLERLPLLTNRPAIAIGATLAICAFAFAIRRALAPVIVEGFPFLSFFPTVLLIGVLLGFRMGLLAGLITLALAWRFFLPVQHRDLFAGGPPNAVVIYAVVMVALLWLIQQVHRSTARLVSERERSRQYAETRQLLFRELQHRVSNNLQVASALLSLQRQAVGDDASRLALDHAAQRLTVIGSISRQLYDEEGRPRAIRAFLEPLCHDVVRASGREDIRAEVTADDALTLGSRAAVPVALIVAEAVANALEHGFAGRRGGRIAVRAAPRREGGLLVEISDDGSGLPPDFTLARHGGLGLRIASLLAQQIGGRFELDGDHRGATARIVVP